MIASRPLAGVRWLGGSAGRSAFGTAVELQDLIGSGLMSVRFARIVRASLNALLGLWGLPIALCWV